MVVSISFSGKCGVYYKELILNSTMLKLFDKAICKDIFIRVQANYLKDNGKDKFIRYELKECIY